MIGAAMIWAAGWAVLGGIVAVVLRLEALQHRVSEAERYARDADLRALIAIERADAALCCVGDVEDEQREQVVVRYCSYPMTFSRN